MSDGERPAIRGDFSSPWEFLSQQTEENVQTILESAMHRKHEKGCNIVEAVYEVCEMSPPENPRQEMMTLIQASVNVLIRQDDLTDYEEKLIVFGESVVVAEDAE